MQMFVFFQIPFTEMITLMMISYAQLITFKYYFKSRQYVEYAPKEVVSKFSGLSSNPGIPAFYYFQINFKLVFSVISISVLTKKLQYFNGTREVEEKDMIC